MNLGRGQPGVEAIIDEMTALNLCNEAYEDPSLVPDCRYLVKSLPTPEFTSVESFVIATAQTYILGQVPTLTYQGTPCTLVDHIGLAWVKSQAGQDTPELRALDFNEEGAVSGLCLEAWSNAILTKNPQESRKLYDRASDLGSGFSYQPMLLWTMAATFFPRA